jgi:hypothetical protein
MSEVLAERTRQRQCRPQVDVLVEGAADGQQKAPHRHLAGHTPVADRANGLHDLDHAGITCRPMPSPAITAMLSGRPVATT